MCQGETNGEAQYRDATAQATLAINFLVNEGMNQWDAYRAAKLKGKTRQAASDYFKRWRPAVDYRKRMVAADSEKRRERSVKRVEAYANASLGDILADAGMPTWWAKLSPELQRTVSKVKIDGAGTWTIELEPRMRAEERLAKLCGMDKPTEVKVTGELSDEVRVGLEAALAEVRKRAA